MNFLFTCGGTAGHINPAIAIAGELRRRDPGCGILFVGAEGKMETDLVPREGYDIKTVNITNISRGKSIQAIKHNIDTLKNVIEATKASEEIIKDFKPDAVIGTGGYVCYPVLKAASKLNIPTFIHESNAVPGLTTKMLLGKVSVVMLGLEESVEYYGKAKKVVVTGTPVRGSFDSYTKSSAKKELGYSENETVVLSVWGSLGAKHMNEIVSEMLIDKSEEMNFSIIHSAGATGFEKMSETLENAGIDINNKKTMVQKYIYNMPCVLSAADIVICRSGASTLSELAYIGKPSILVPSPNVTNNHQEKNARVFEKVGASKLILESDADSKRIYDEICSLVNNKDELESMSSNAKTISVYDSINTISNLILEYCK